MSQKNHRRRRFSGLLSGALVMAVAMAVPLSAEADPRPDGAGCSSYSCAANPNQAVDVLASGPSGTWRGGHPRP